MILPTLLGCIRTASIRQSAYLGVIPFSSSVQTLRRASSLQASPVRATSQVPSISSLYRHFSSSIKPTMSISPPLSPSLETKLRQLQNYTSCDIADALLQLHHPTGGFLPDLFPVQDAPFSARPSLLSPQITIAPAFTVLFIPRSLSPLEAEAQYGPSNMPPSTHWADLSLPDTFMVVGQPKEQTNAVLGGIMALRAKVRGVRGIIVRGRVRDVAEIAGTGLSVWAQATSIVGSGQAAKAHATQVPLDFDGTIVRPGDWVFSDSVNGVAVIPREKLDELVALLPTLVEVDDKVRDSIAGGMGVGEAFRRFR